MGKGADNYILVMFQISETLTFDLPKKRTLSDLLCQMSVTVFLVCLLTLFSKLLWPKPYEPVLHVERTRNIYLNSVVLFSSLANKLYASTLRNFFCHVKH